MEVFAEYLGSMNDPQQRERMEHVLSWVGETFADLVPKIAWNQPMFTDHDTFIIAFSTAKQHLSVAPEKAGIDRFAQQIVQAGYTHTNQLFRIPWKSEVNYELLQEMIQFNLEDKAGCSTFWR
ncbi:iron chaperone [Paenibacillus shenyangensis]|uniref:iron chaperone n=1 Tax=Paenibacillus sp. A9 TaxID=1284352 RepID=UPI00036742DB|nr:iron chaperone [Paenibacillus sp. A9]